MTFAASCSRPEGAATGPPAPDGTRTYLIGGNWKCNGTIASLEQQVRALEVTVQGVDAEIAGLRERHKVQTADLVAEIGRRSKQIAEISARLGSLDSQKNEFSFMIGQYLSDQIDNPDPEIKKVLRNFTPLTRRIVHLRRSIQYNRRLARRGSR